MDAPALVKEISNIRIMIDSLEESVGKLSKRISDLESENHTILIAISALAEMWRRMDYELRYEDDPPHAPLGRYSFIIDAADPQPQSVRIAVTRLSSKSIQLDFISDPGDNEQQEHN